MVYRSLGEFFREAAVLIWVFGNLEPLLRSGPFSLKWASGVLGCALLLLSLGLWLGSLVAE